MTQHPFSLPVDKTLTVDNARQRRYPLVCDLFPAFIRENRELVATWPRRAVSSARAALETGTRPSGSTNRCGKLPRPYRMPPVGHAAEGFTFSGTDLR
jgi:hypothetical protein